MALNYLEVENVMFIFCLVVSSLFLIPRWYVRIYTYGPLKQLSTYRMSEWLVLFSWLEYIWWTWECVHWNINGWYGSDAHMEYVQKFEFATSCLYQPGLYATKAALLLYYMELSPRQNSRKLWYAFMLTWLLLVYGVIQHLSLKFFNCLPLYKNWKAEYGFGRPCKLKNNFYIVTFVPHFLSDVIIYVLPFFILRQIKHIARVQLVGAGLMFGLGFVNVAILTTIWGIDLYTQFHGGLHLSAAGDYFTMILPFTSIVIVCIPYCRRSWVDFSEWRGRGKTGKPRLFKSGVFSTIIRTSGRTAVDETTVAASATMAADMGEKGRDLEVGIASVPSNSHSTTQTSI